MKLIDLLKVIPDEYGIGLAYDNNGSPEFVFGNNKYDAITELAYKKRFIKEQVENMNVCSVRPYANVQCSDTQLLERDVPPLYVKPGIIMDIE